MSYREFSPQTKGCYTLAPDCSTIWFHTHLTHAPRSAPAGEDRVCGNLFGPDTFVPAERRPLGRARHTNFRQPCMHACEGASWSTSHRDRLGIWQARRAAVSSSACACIDLVEAGIQYATNNCWCLGGGTAVGFYRTYRRGDRVWPLSQSHTWTGQAGRAPAPCHGGRSKQCPPRP